MSFGQRLRSRRKDLGMSQGELAKALGVSLSAVSNYENGLNTMREDVLLRLFKVLDIDPNYLYQDSLPGNSFSCSVDEEALVRKYRSLHTAGQQAVHAVVDALAIGLAAQEADPLAVIRQLPLCCTPSAAGYSPAVFGDVFYYIEVTAEVSQGPEFAVHIQGDSMQPYIQDGDVVYVNRDPLTSGDVGIFCVDGEMLCKQYVRDRPGIVYLFSLNRRRSDADVVLPRDSGRTMVCFGRVLLSKRPNPPRMAL